ncbi:hypothetical protein D3C86_1555240 [compost metagenome]
MESRTVHHDVRAAVGPLFFPGIEQMPNCTWLVRANPANRRVAIELARQYAEAHVVSGVPVIHASVFLLQPISVDPHGDVREDDVVLGDAALMDPRHMLRRLLISK